MTGAAAQPEQQDRRELLQWAEDERAEVQQTARDTFAELKCITKQRDAAVERAVRAERELAALRERILDGHHEYLPAAVDYDCCAECNRIANDYIAWPCPVIAAFEAAGEPTSRPVVTQPQETT